jgi:hypothetical protein
MKWEHPELLHIGEVQGYALCPEEDKPDRAFLWYSVNSLEKNFEIGL